MGTELTFNAFTDESWTNFQALISSMSLTIALTTRHRAKWTVEFNETLTNKQEVRVINWEKPIEIYNTLNFHKNANPYLEFNVGTTWTTIAAFQYVGSDEFPITKVTCIVSRDGTTGTSRWRLRDTTNNNTLAVASWTTANRQISKDANTTTVPTAKAMLELQVKQVTGGASLGRMWTCTTMKHTD